MWDYKKTPPGVQNCHEYDFFKTFSIIAEGYLTVETLSSILLELEPDLSDEQLKEIIDEVDEDGSGTIDYDGNFNLSFEFSRQNDT
mgnify:FL=1